MRSLRNLFVLSIPCLLLVSRAASAATCTSLTSLQLPDTTITLAQPVLAGCRRLGPGQGQHMQGHLCGPQASSVQILGGIRHSHSAIVAQQVDRCAYLCEDARLGPAVSGDLLGTAGVVSGTVVCKPHMDRPFKAGQRHTSMEGGHADCD